MVYAYEEPLAKLWNVSYSMLPTLLGYEKNLMKVDERLLELLEQDEYFTSIGGTFIDVPGNKLHINVLSDAIDVVKHNLESKFQQDSHLFVFKPVKNSIAALVHTFGQILNITKRLKPLVITCYISAESNYVFLKSYQQYDEQNRGFFDAIRQISQYNETVKHHNVPSIPNTQPSFVETNNMEIDAIGTRILAGDGVYNKDLQGRCSLGFWAKSKDLKSTYIVTSGHCSTNESQSFYHCKWNENVCVDLIGSMKFKRSYPLDAGLISIDNKKIIELFDTVVAINNVDSEQNDELTVYDGTESSSNGAHICKSGYATHVTCGKIIAFNGFFINKEQLLAYPLTFSTAKSGVSDSGGPVFSYKPDLKQ
ncbi:11218_t:CDS:1, partial [Ambispora leptoticha]